MHIIRHPLRSNAEGYSSKISRLNQRIVIIGYPVAETCTTHHFFLLAVGLGILNMLSNVNHMGKFWHLLQQSILSSVILNQFHCDNKKYLQPKIFIKMVCINLKVSLSMCMS